MVRWARLLPKTAVAHNAATPATEPISAVPTGTARVPRPRSRACRMPMTAPGGAPAAAAAPATADGRVAGARPAAVRTRAARSAGRTPSTITTATVASAPRPSIGASNDSPGAGSASLASPSGASGDSSVATAIPPAAPATATIRVRSMIRTASSRGLRPRVDSTGWSALSALACRASACPTTATAASAASAASTRQPTACGWIEAVIVAAGRSRSCTPAPSRLLVLASNRAKSACPWRSRT